MSKASARPSDKEETAFNKLDRYQPEPDEIEQQVRFLVLQLQTARRPSSRATAARRLGLLWNLRNPTRINDWIADALQRALNPFNIYATAEWEDWTVRINAAWASGYFGRVSPDTLTGANRNRNTSLAASCPWERWQPLPKPPLTTALRGLKSRQWFVRLFSAYCLQGAAMRPAEELRTVIALTSATRDPDKDVRVWAIHAIGQMRRLDAIGPLADRLGDPDRHVRRVAVRTLATLTQPMFPYPPEEMQLRFAVEREMTALLLDRTASYRMKAGAAQVTGHGGFGREASQGLRRCAALPDAQCRRQAAWALGRLHVGNPRPVLRQLAGDENAGVRKAAREALARWGVIH